MIFLDQYFMIDHLGLRSVHWLLVVILILNPAISRGDTINNALRRMTTNRAHLLTLELPLTPPIGHISLYVVLESQKNFFNRIWLHVHDLFDLFLTQVQAKLLKYFDIECVPVVCLL